MKILELFKGFLSERGLDFDLEIENIRMDSRLVGRGDVFFAIGGGNAYVKSCLEAGAALVIYDDKSLKIEDKRAVMVEDTIGTMQELAKDYRRMLDIRVVGITGTNGKTSTKDFIYSVLSQRYRGIKSQGNYNNQIGLPYTILQLRDEDEVAVLEMGMSSFGEIDRLCDISGIDYGVMTNIGESHLEFLKTVDNVFKAKGEMLRYLAPENRILFGDDQYLGKVEGIKVGTKDSNSLKIEGISEDEEGVSFILAGEEYRVNVTGGYNAINASLAVAVGKTLGMSYEEIKKGLEGSELSPMRSEKVVKGEKTYINDAYNADPMSMREALLSYGKLYNDTYKVAVLGDMLELGEGSRDYHRGLAEVLESIRIDRVYLYGKEMKALADKMRDTEMVTHHEDKEEIKKEVEQIEEKTTILLKGSRGMRLEEIIR